MFVWAETTKRIDALGARLDRLDEHGSRGVDHLRAQIDRLRADMLQHEEQHAERDAEQRTARRWAAGIIVMLVTPLYPLLIWLIQRQSWPTEPGGLACRPRSPNETDTRPSCSIILVTSAGPVSPLQRPSPRAAVQRTATLRSSAPGPRVYLAAARRLGGAGVVRYRLASH